jgi:hypothetical protein
MSRAPRSTARAARARSLRGYDLGIRKGQLARTLREYVDLRRGVIAWPPAECKSHQPHVIPLEGRVRAIVTRLMKVTPLCFGSISPYELASDVDNCLRRTSTTD